MTDITIGQAQRLTAPCPFALLSTLRPDGGTNLMAVSWWSYLSNRPPMLGVCLSKKGLSGELIHASGEFALSIVDASLRDAALRCGMTTVLFPEENRKDLDEVDPKVLEKMKLIPVKTARDVLGLALVP